MDDSPTGIYRIDANRLVAATAERIWQEYTCEDSGIDFDRVGAQLLFRGQRFECPGCWRMHTAGIDGPLETILLRPDGELEYRRLPVNAQQRQHWLDETADWNKRPG